MVGKVFGRLTVDALHSKDSVGRKSWVCSCECGGIKVATGDNLRRGLTQSCGCLQKQRASDASITHGMARTPTYIVWANMVARCTNSESQSWHNYGGRGITVCERWLTFSNFLEDMGERPEGMSLDRRDNSKGYEPGNCRWATREEQANNTRSNLVIEFEGQKKSASEWGRERGIPGYLVAQRIRRGWSAYRAITQPVVKS